MYWIPVVTNLIVHLFADHNVPRDIFIDWDPVYFPRFVADHYKGPGSRCRVVLDGGQLHCVPFVGFGIARIRRAPV